MAGDFPPIMSKERKYEIGYRFLMILLNRTGVKKLTADDIAEELRITYTELRVFLALLEIDVVEQRRKLPIKHTQKPLPPIAPSRELPPKNPKKRLLRGGDRCPDCKKGRVGYFGNKKGMRSNCHKPFDIE